MIQIRHKQDCNGCSACVHICPRQCMEMITDAEGFLYPVIHVAQCIDCHSCENVCPILHPSSCDKTEEDVTAFAAYHKDENVRRNSSSGGVFTAVAVHVLAQGGVVFGAAFDEDLHVKHKFVDAQEELDQLRGSKYVQSEIGNAYAEAECFLKEGRMVLFTGTPCQIGGLYAYLKWEYPSLITQDIICHGVPSPLVWQKYVEHREALAASKTRRTFFRHKKYGWKMYSVRFEFTNRTEYEQIFQKDLFMQGFLTDLCLRPSCYHCAFKKNIRESDYTLADFWGIQNALPEMDDDRGTSLLFVNSEKGSAIFEQIKNDIMFQKVDIDQAIKYNTAMVQSARMPKKRDGFMAAIAANDFSYAAKKYLVPSFSVKILKCGNHVLRKWKRKIKSYIK